MAILNQITVGNKLILETDVAPNSGSGTAGSPGNIVLVNNTTSTNGEVWVNLSGTATGWDRLSTLTDGNVGSGSFLNIPIYNTSSSGYTLAGSVLQNSQSIQLSIAAQPSRSAGLVYTIPDPGDAVTAANVVLDQGAYTIAGAWTFSSAAIFNGNVTMNGSLTYVHSTQTQISDPLITLNEGGAASSGAGVGFEIQENSIITGYLKTSSTRDGYVFLAPAIGFSATESLANLTASQTFSFPNASGSFVLQPATAAGVANQIPFWSSATSLSNPTGTTTNSLYWDSTNFRLGIGNVAPSVALHVTGSARVSGLSVAGYVTNDASGNLSTVTAIPLGSGVSGVLPIANGGTNSSTALNSNRIMVSSGGAIVEAAALTNGQILIGSTGAAPVAASLTAGTGVTITPSAGGITIAATGSGGTVTSVALTAPSFLSVAGSPITGSGTLALSLATQSANTIFAGPTTGSAAAPTFRAQVAADLPQMTNGQLYIGSTGASVVAATLAAGTNAGVTITNAAGSITLSTVQDIRTSASPSFTGLTVSGLSTAGVVHNSSAGVLSTSLVSLTADVSGVLPLVNGGTGVAAASANAAFNALSPMTTLGDTIYGGTSGAGTRLAGNTTAVKLFKTQTGTGTVSAAPVWAAIAAADLPTITLTGNVTGSASGGSITTTIAALAVTNSMIAAGTIDLTAKVTGILPVANGGTNSSTALNSNRIMVSSGGKIVEAAALTNGQLLIGSTGAAPVAAALAVGGTSSVSITNGAGSITIDAIQDIRTSASPSFSGLSLASTVSTNANYTVTQSQVSTTTATATTIATVATASDQVMMLEARVVARRTGGTAGATDDSATYVRHVKIKNVGGTVTVALDQSTFTAEDQTTWNVTFLVSSTNVLIQVTGATNNNINWACTAITQTI